MQAKLGKMLLIFVISISKLNETATRFYEEVREAHSDSLLVRHGLNPASVFSEGRAISHCAYPHPSHIQIKNWCHEVRKWLQSWVAVNSYSVWSGRIYKTPLWLWNFLPSFKKPKMPQTFFPKYRMCICVLCGWWVRVTYTDVWLLWVDFTHWVDPNSIHNSNFSAFLPSSWNMWRA